MTTAYFERGALRLEVDHNNQLDEADGIILQHDPGYGGEASVNDGHGFVVLPSIYPVDHPKNGVEVAGGKFVHEPGSVQVVRPGELHRPWKDPKRA